MTVFFCKTCFNSSCKSCAALVSRFVRIKTELVIEIHKRSYNFRISKSLLHLGNINSLAQLCVSCCEQITWLFKCSVLLFMAQFSVQTFFFSFNKQLHVLYDACEYKAAKITKLNKDFLLTFNFELI